MHISPFLGSFALSLATLTLLTLTFLAIRLRNRPAKSPAERSWFAILETSGGKMLETFPLSEEDVRSLPNRDDAELEDEHAGYAFFCIFSAIENGFDINGDTMVTLYLDDGTEYATFRPDIEGDKVVGVTRVGTAA